MSVQWSEERILETVTVEFIRSKLRAEGRERLDKPLEVGEDLANSTYGEWISSRARKLFLILVQIGVPDTIFDIVDNAFDDDDLPLNSDETARLNLSELNSEFSRAQAQLCPKEVTRRKIEPQIQSKLAIEVISSSRSLFSGSRNSGLTDTVRIVGTEEKVFTRLCILFGRPPSYTRKQDFLQDVDLIKRTKYQHIISLKTAYFGENCGYVLLSPTLEFPLRSFFSNLPKFFKGLPTLKQQEVLLNWPHCLACTLQFLHKQGLSHGKIVPSNIFVDSFNRIYLGFSIFAQSIQSQRKKDATDSYEYGPPERLLRVSLSRAEMVLPPRSPPPRSPLPARPSFSDSDGSMSPYPAWARSFRPSNRRSDSSSTYSHSSASTFYSLASLSDVASSRPSFSSIDTYPSSFQEEDSREILLSPTESGVSLPQQPTEDLRPGDTFSLGCLTLEIITFMMKGKPSRRNSALDPASGGGPSFYANPAAVGAFIDNLENLAANRTEPVFRGISPILTLVRRMLNPEPEMRPAMIEVVRSMEDSLVHSSRLSYLHCGGGGQC